MTTKIATLLTASFVIDGNFVRSTKDWQAVARIAHAGKGRDAAKAHASNHGYSVMVWENGRAALYVRDDESGDLIRIKFNGTPVRPAEVATTPAATTDEPVKELEPADGTGSADFGALGRL